MSTQVPSGTSWSHIPRRSIVGAAWQRWRLQALIYLHPIDLFHFCSICYLYPASPAGPKTVKLKLDFEGEFGCAWQICKCSPAQEKPGFKHSNNRQGGFRSCHDDSDNEWWISSKQRNRLFAIVSFYRSLYFYRSCSNRYLHIAVNGGKQSILGMRVPMALRLTSGPACQHQGFCGLHSAIAQLQEDPNSSLLGNRKTSMEEFMNVFLFKTYCTIASWFKFISCSAEWY